MDWGFAFDPSDRETVATHITRAMELGALSVAERPGWLTLHFDRVLSVDEMRHITDVC